MIDVIIYPCYSLTFIETVVDVGSGIYDYVPQEAVDAFLSKL